MKVEAILEHFLERANWVNRAKTVDRIIIGNPDEEVDFCTVSWMPSFNVIRESVKRGARLLICHEPTLWDHWDNLQKADPLARDKIRFIEKNKLTILRNHDCWDLWPVYGVPWRWAEFLGFKGQPTSTSVEGFLHRYDVPPLTLQQLARKVARRCAKVGESKVQVVGELSQRVSRIGIGTGCYCDMREFIRMGCDCTIICDDSGWYWEQVQMAEDLGIAVIRVNHGTAEEYGLEGLAEYINQHMNGALRAEFIRHGCSFKLV